ncbi:MAG: response regulator [Gemmatimonadota bacterium]
MIRVIVADDHPVVRRGLRAIISDQEDMEIVGEATTGREVLSLVRRVYADVLLLDIGMPGPAIIPLMEELQELRSRLAVLVFSSHPEERYAVRLLKMGAAGYLPKDCSEDLLGGAIRRVAGGKRFISANLAEILALGLQGEGAGKPHEALSAREYHVMMELAAGKSVTKVARELNLSPKTVSTYRARVMEKMSFSTNTDLIRYALNENLIE